jgi:hypothetical protein
MRQRMLCRARGTILLSLRYMPAPAFPGTFSMS